MKSLRPLQSHMNRALFAVILLAFMVTGTIVGRHQYIVGQQEVARVLGGQIKIAKSLIPALLLAHDYLFQSLIASLAGLDDQEILAKLQGASEHRDPFDVAYVLDRSGRIVQIDEKYKNYQGFNPSHMDHIIEDRKVSRVFQSVFSKRAVVALKYRLNNNLLLVYERDVRSILPALVHLEKGNVLAEQSFILLTTEGVVAYHPDQSLVASRHNLLFDMKNIEGPNPRGLYSYQYQKRSYYTLREVLDTPQGWTLYLQVPAQPVIVDTVKGIILHLAEILFLFLVVTFAMQFIHRRFFLRPVSSIVAALANYRPGAGKEALFAKEPEVQEFARISRAINVMAKDVSQATERFQSLVDSLDALVYVADMETYELLYINKYGRDIWGDIAGKICWQTLQDGQDGPCPFCTNHLLLDDLGQPKDTHVWQFQNTMTGNWYECRDQAIQWTGDRLVRMEIAIDITSRKLAEDALAAEKERLSVTLASIGDGVITTDTSGKIVFVNGVAEELTGWSLPEAVGRNLSEVFHVVHPKTRDASPDPVGKVLSSGQFDSFGHHTLLISRDGRERRIADNGAPIRDANNEIIGVVLVFRDETEKLRLLEESLKGKKLESVGVLAGGIAHDFNNILTAILGNISLTLLDDHISDKARNLLIDAEKASVRAKNLTQQLLTFAKGGEPVKKSASIATVIRDSANFVLHGSKVSCCYDIPDDLWLVEIDQGQMSQVVQNLIINAKEAMPDGGEIEVACANIKHGMDVTVLQGFGSDQVRITIHDNGPGIDEDTVGKIFDPYFTTKAEGSGLGLAISHSIVSRHGGHLSVESSPHHGTTFIICLPASGQTEVGREEEEKTSVKGRKGRIMIMDDEEMIRNVASEMLVLEGHEVVFAKNGEEALDLYKESLGTPDAIDLIIMDLTIPGGMGGKEAVVELLAIDADAKVVVASGYSTDPIMAHHQDYGFVAALVKPFEIHSFYNVINEVLGAD